FDSFVFGPVFLSPSLSLSCSLPHSLTHSLQCQIPFVGGDTDPSMAAMATVNFTVGQVYTVAVEFGIIPNDSFWGVLITPSIWLTTNHSQATFLGGTHLFSLTRRKG